MWAWAADGGRSRRRCCRWLCMSAMRAWAADCSGGGSRLWYYGRWAFRNWRDSMTWRRSASWGLDLAITDLRDDGWRRSSSRSLDLTIADLRDNVNRLRGRWRWCRGIRCRSRSTRSGSARCWSRATRCRSTRCRPIWRRHNGSGISWGVAGGRGWGWTSIETAVCAVARLCKGKCGWLG